MTSAALPGAVGLVALVLSFSASSLPGCTTNDIANVIAADGGAEAGAIDEGDAGAIADAAADVDAARPAINPYGVPYPTKNIGTRGRSGSTPGSVIANLTFTGYVPEASNTTSVQFADLYDPLGMHHDIVALLLESSWDPVSNELMQNLRVSGLPLRVATVVILGEATERGTPAKLPDVAPWRTQCGLPPAWFLLDPEHQSFPNALYDKSAYPAIIILDARTMEIVSAAIGEPPKPKEALEMVRDQVKARAPSY